MAMESGDRNLQLVARGATMEEPSMLQKFVAEKWNHCSRAPEEVNIGEINESETIPSEDGRDRTVSVLKIELDGIGDLPPRRRMIIVNPLSFFEFIRSIFKHTQMLPYRIF